MPKRDLSKIPPPTAFLAREEVAGRWRRSELTTQRLLRKHHVPVYRLSSKIHLYALEDIERIEAQAKIRPPFRVRSTWTKSPKEAAS